MKHFITFALAGLTVCAAAGAADSSLEIKTEQDKVNYSVGFQVGSDFKRQGIGLTPEAMIKGISDALSGAKPVMSQEEMRTTLVELKRKVVVQDQAEAQKLAKARLSEARAFLDANAKRDGVVTLPSGLQYKVLKEGSGKRPTGSDPVTVNYKASLTNGTEFDSSAGTPVTFEVDQAIKGWAQALKLMKPGSHWEIFVPPELGYGERSPLRDRVVILDVELLSVGKQEKTEPPASTPGTERGAP